MEYNIERSAKNTAKAYDSLDIPLDGSPISNERTINNDVQSSKISSERDNLGIYMEAKPEVATAAQEKFWDEVQNHDDPNKGVNILRSEDGSVVTVPHQLDKAGKKMAELLDSEDPIKLGEAKEFHDMMQRRLQLGAARANPELADYYWKQFGKATNFYENNTVGGDRVKMVDGKLPEFNFDGAQLPKFNVEESAKKVAGYLDTIETGSSVDQAQKSKNMFASLELNAEMQKFSTFLDSQPADQQRELNQRHIDATVKHDDRSKGLNVVRDKHNSAYTFMVSHELDQKAEELARKLDAGDPDAKELHDETRASLISGARRPETGIFRYRQFAQVVDTYENDKENGDNLKVFQPRPGNPEAITLTYKDKPEAKSE